MTGARVRLTSTAFPSLRAWFLVNPEQHTTVDVLKHELCKSVLALNEKKVKAEEVSLWLDGFELLGSCAVEGLVRDGDLIEIRWEKTSAKRKADHVEEPPRKKLKLNVKLSPEPQRKAKSPSPIESSSSESDSDSSSASASSDSSDDDSDTDSTSSSNSDSSAPSSMPSSQQVTRLLSTKPKQSTLKPAAKPSPPIPPGHGKLQTQSRNRRRRLKKMHERAEIQEQLPNVLSLASSSANAVPLGSTSAKQSSQLANESVAQLTGSPDQSTKDPNTSVSVANLVSDLVQNENEPAILNEARRKAKTPAERMILASLSLSNKNKKKGFKSHIADFVPSQKIVFSESSQPAASSAPPKTPSSFDLPRLVPPSEMPDLPANLFVTSVDVEAHLRRQKKAQLKQAFDNAYDESQGYDTSWEGKMGLNYGEEGAAMDYGGEQEGQGANTGSGETLDVAKVERDWESYEQVNGPEDISVGTSVGWKALTLNPETFTPEVALHVARVVSPPSSFDGQVAVKVKWLIKPKEFADEEAEEEGRIVEEEEEVQWSAEAAWKIISATA